MSAEAISSNLDWHRVPPPSLVRTLYPGIRAWQRDVEDGRLSVFVGRELTGMDNGDRIVLWHLSISHRSNEANSRPGRYPTWDEIHEARYRFIPDEVNVAMFLPPKSEYINVHATTFHLWELAETTARPSGMPAERPSWATGGESE